MSIEARICHSHEAAEVLRLRAALTQIEELTSGGKGQSAVNMIAQLALNTDVPTDDLTNAAGQDVIIRETLLEVLSHAVDGVVPIEAIQAMEAAIVDLPTERDALAADPGPLVAAVEGVVRAAASLREFERAPLCAIRGRDGAEWERLRLALDTALAAYRAALKGGKV